MAARSSNFTCGINCTDCSCENNVQFHDRFQNVIPNVYASGSVLSVIGCLLVFITYCRLRRLSGYLPKILVVRTALDFIIAIVHIVSRATRSARNDDTCCKLLGAVLQFVLVASSGWLLVLALDLFLSIRNPFSQGSKLRLRYHLLVWTPSMVTAIVLVASGTHSNIAGRSMFYFCWVSIANLQTFKRYSWGLLVGPYIILFCTSVAILIFATVVLWKRLPTSNKIRTHILKQNTWCVFVLTSEILIAGGLWMSEYISIRKRRLEMPNFCCQHSFMLAIAFAVVHSLRGVVDCITWFVTFSIGPKDMRYLWNQAFTRCRKNWQAPSELTMPLMMPDSTVDKALRKDVTYCINRGILDLIDRVIKRKEGAQNLGQVVNRTAASVMIGQVTADEDTDAEQKMLENSFELNTRKIKFAPSSNCSVFSFVSMEPSVFYLLWKSQNLNFETFKQSFHIEDTNDVDGSGMLEKFTEGKSGSFFYFTHDRRYIIKTVTSEEEKFLRKIASLYYRHIKDNPYSLIVRLYGLYQVRLAWEQKYISVILMENVFHSLEHLKIHEKYDLKGSTAGRRVKRGNVSAGVTLKDLDLQKKIYVGPENKTAVLEQLAKDTAFLAGLQIMDYSMVLGIHDHNQQNRRLTESITMDGFQAVQRNTGYERHSQLIEQQPRENSFINVNSQFRQDYGGVRSYSPYHPLNMSDETISIFPTTYDGQRIEEMPVATYYFGIIDILQEYNLWKKLEHFWKTKVCRRNAQDVSVIDPIKYRERFLNYMAKKVFE